MAISILIVDDSETVRAVIVKALRLAQVPAEEIHQAGNGEEAWKVLGEHWIDLVFCDINMPVMGGLELIGRMRADEILKNTPVVVVTTEGSSKRIEELKQKGVNAYIRKPFTPEMIRKVVFETLGLSDGIES